jgi:hypothetical protein
MHYLAFPLGFLIGYTFVRIIQLLSDYYNWP